jgi:dienelactone hydrolase
MKTILLSSGLLLMVLFSSAQAKETVTFSSKDGLQITADTYLDKTEKNRPLIVLFHQAAWSRGEYNEIAPKLNKLGFDALAVDLRSGKAVNGVINQTAKGAQNAGKNMRYIDALPDMESALLYARTLARKRAGKDAKVIAWGSSYSSALVLQLIGEKPELADAVLSFSPGEYFKKSGKPRDWVQKSAESIDIPVFITSAKSEKGRWSAIFKAIKSKNKVSFTPKTNGNV